jgi:hypothetical protein
MKTKPFLPTASFCFAVILSMALPLATAASNAKPKVVPIPADDAAVFGCSRRLEPTTNEDQQGSAGQHCYGWQSH